ncbi:MAG: DUF2851 family protein [Saprospiraceae bacterium]|nr:DUF2851 family protein [Saprospiraceae bacterium]
MESPSIIREDFLHYVWKTKQFDLSRMVLVDGRNIKILRFGNHNHDAGPDFSEGLIEIDGIRWAGNIEIHVQSSQWKAHGHQKDPAYDNVILHVVLEDDAPVKRADGTLIPTLELKDLIIPTLFKNYARLMSSSGWIPCENMIQKVDPYKVSLWLNKVGVERLERKTNEVENLLSRVNNDWERLSFIMISRYMGSKVNTFPMELMALQCDLKILAKNRNSVETIEAILFGISGLLNSSYEDEYPTKLKREFSFYKKKYNLKSINPVAWKFSKMRPSNFPTIRISQIANLIHKNHFLLRSFIDAEDIHQLKHILNCEASPYWDDHYRFDKSSKQLKKKLSNSWIEMLIINVVAPLLFIYGNHIGDQNIKDKAISFIESIPSEKNSIISKWKDLGIGCKNALQSQGSLRLKQVYCQDSRCLECSIGNDLIKF